MQAKPDLAVSAISCLSSSTATSKHRPKRPVAQCLLCQCMHLASVSASEPVHAFATASAFCLRPELVRPRVSPQAMSGFVVSIVEMQYWAQRADTAVPEIKPPYLSNKTTAVCWCSNGRREKLEIVFSQKNVLINSGFRDPQRHALQQQHIIRIDTRLDKASRRLTQEV
eukprot:GHVQ01012520.1.p3 GENE.GHVQ01012520.1~~GHVQ01012520.1.p3  ORF type:complete len:169 (+),score=19.70 GHVQ01012520.1:1270-1776(+)